MENKLNKGAMFRNSYKKQDSHPDFRGTINVDGIEKDIAAWVNVSEKGDKYFSLSISEHYVKPEAASPSDVDDMMNETPTQGGANNPLDERDNYTTPTQTDTAPTTTDQPQPEHDDLPF